MIRNKEIPEKFADVIESCEGVRSGQIRKYGPYEEVYDVYLKTDKPDEGRVLEFCQECCHKCSRTEAQLNEVRADRSLTFDQLMDAIAEGSYTLKFYPDEKRCRYTWSQDYLD